MSPVLNLAMIITLNRRSSALIFPFSWPWSHFASSTSIGRSKNRQNGELLSRMSLHMRTLDLKNSELCNFRTRDEVGKSYSLPTK